jgi:hypothetical protein
MVPAAENINRARKGKQAESKVLVCQIYCRKLLFFMKHSQAEATPVHHVTKVWTSASE